MITFTIPQMFLSTQVKIRSGMLAYDKMLHSSGWYRFIEAILTSTTDVSQSIHIAAISPLTS